MNREILDKNLLSLTTTSSETVKILSQCGDHCTTLKIETSRDGKLIPFVLSDRGEKPLHSRFNPEREGLRFSEQFKKGGTILAYGLGAAYHLIPLLSDPELVSLIIVDTDASQIKKILSEIDLTPLFLDKRVSLWISDSPSDFRHYMLSKYIPVLSGDLQSISLRTRVESNPDFFHEVAEVVNDAIQTITDDYTVQTHFGKKWFINTLSNLKASEETTLTLFPVNDVLITAAGPSLEDQMDHLIKQRSGSTLIATDTSLPVLLGKGIIPDLVISIDCQHISYHHFLKGYPEDVPLVLDLASPPFLTRIARKCFFFTSDHPFSNYVSQNFRQFPRIDTSGGNVTHAALSLAESLGARRIRLYGADFSYPHGKPYARGSYIYPYFQKSSTRTDGLENQFTNFILHNKSLERESFENGFRYISKPMIHYKQSLELKASSMSARIEHIRSDGVKLSMRNSGIRNSEDLKMMCAGETYKSRHEFINTFAEKIKKMPPVKGTLSEYLGSLNKDQRGILMSVLPAAAHFRKNCISGESSLNKAIEWTLNLLERKTFL